MNGQDGRPLIEHLPNSDIQVYDYGVEKLGEMTPEEIQQHKERLLGISKEGYRVIHQDVIVERRVITKVRVVTVVAKDALAELESPPKA